MKILDGKFEIKKDSTCYTLVTKIETIANEDNERFNIKKGDIVTSSFATYHGTFTEVLNKIVEMSPKHAKTFDDIINIMKKIKKEIEEIKEILKTKKS